MDKFNPYELNQRFHYDNLTGGFAIETFQDIAPYLKANREVYNANSVSSRYCHKDTAVGVHLASIPEVVLHKWMKEFQAERNLPRPPGVADPEFKVYMFKKARSPEYRALRVDGRTWR